MKISKSRLGKLAGILSEGNDRDLDEIEGVTSEDALFDKDPADAPPDEFGDGGEPSGAEYIQEMRRLQRAVLLEMKHMESLPGFLATSSGSVLDHVKSKGQAYYLKVDDETLASLVDHLFTEKEMSWWMQQNLNKSPADYANWLMGEIDKSVSIKEFFTRRDWKKLVTAPALELEEREYAQRQAAARSEERAAREAEYKKVALIHKVVRAAQDQKVDAFTSLLGQLGVQADPQFTGDQITKIRDILGDMSAYSPFDNATSYVEGLMPITESRVKRIIHEELMEGRMWDYFRGMTEPRGPWKDATGMSHQDMIGYQPISADKAAHDLAVALADRIDDHASGWDGPMHPSMADMEKGGFHRIDGNHWNAVLEAVGPATAAQAEAVLDKWKKDRYIVTTQPDVFQLKGFGPTSGIWLRWYGYKEMKHLRDKGKQSASIQYGTY